MISPDVASALLRELGFRHDAAPAAGVHASFAFACDFDSDAPFADLPFDPAAPAARYPSADRAALHDLLDEAAALLAAHAPAARAFVDAQLDRAMIRRAAGGAASSSNRDHVGVCVLTNLHVAPDRLLVAVEAIVHEAIHQHLYRVEVSQGPFCDLAAPRRYRSPWSGNRIPLHSLVHACFVYYGLLSLWCRLAAAPAVDAAVAALVRDRIAANLFGFAFVRGLLDGPTFPLHSVDPAIVALIRNIADATAAASLPVGDAGRLVDALAACGTAPWVAGLSSALGDLRVDHRRAA